MTPKREQLEHLLCNSNIDFLGLTETWLTCSSPEAAVLLPDYNVYRKDRIKGRGGGVLLYVKNTVKCKEILWPKDVRIEGVGVTITLSAEMSFVVLCLYRQPSAKIDFYDHKVDLKKIAFTYCLGLPG